MFSFSVEAMCCRVCRLNLLLRSCDVYCRCQLVVTDELLLRLTLMWAVGGVGVGCWVVVGFAGKSLRIIFAARFRCLSVLAANRCRSRMGLDVHAYEYASKALISISDTFTILSKD